jgi:hypothetical protein
VTHNGGVGVAAGEDGVEVGGHDGGGMMRYSCQVENTT